MRYQIKYLLGNSCKWVTTTKIYDHFEEVQKGCRDLCALMPNLKAFCIDHYNNNMEKVHVVVLQREETL